MNLRLRFTLVAAVLASVVVLSVPVAHTAPTEAEKQIKEGYDAFATAKAVQVPHKMQVFTHGKYSFQLIPPPDFTLKELAPPHGKIYSFSGPKHEDKTAPTLNVNLIIAPDGEELPPTPVIITSLLNPFREHLKDYTEKTQEPLTVNGLSYNVSNFGGTFANGTKISGFVYGAPIKGGYIVFLCQDSASSFEQLRKIF